MSAMERALEHLRAIGRALKPGESLLLRPTIPDDVQARLDARTPEEVARDRALVDEMMDGLYERCGIGRTR